MAACGAEDRLMRWLCLNVRDTAAVSCSSKLRVQTWALVRNMSLVEGCFFRERFTKEFVELLGACGIRLHVLSAPVLQLGTARSTRHHLGLCEHLATLRTSWVDWTCLAGWRRMDQLKVVTELEGGNSQWWASLPQEESKFQGSVWVASDGYFYTLARKIFATCSKRFVTPAYTLQVWGCVLDAACSCRLQDVTCNISEPVAGRSAEGRPLRVRG